MSWRLMPGGEEDMEYDAIVVGSGIAGLTATAYLSKAGLRTLLCEKEPSCGGLINSFERDGFVFDGGIRAMENSGVLLPMLKHLGVELELVRNHVSLGIEDRVIRLESEANVADYQALLDGLYPQSKAEITRIMEKIRLIMKYMKVQYGINNPIFLDMKQDRDYLMKEILPWMVKYALTVPKISALNRPVVDFLRQYTSNQSLLDIISQHFFQQTPAFFALSYITLYLDYNYPLGGTGKLIEKMTGFIERHGGKISTNTEIRVVDPGNRTVIDAQGNHYQYRKLVWAADIKSFYKLVYLENIHDQHVKEVILRRQVKVADKVGNDSVYTVYLAVNLDKSYFERIASGHFFYTPSRRGQSQAGLIPIQAEREEIEHWLEEFFALTTYEISIPVLRDPSLAPEGQSGLIVSVLFDYALTKRIQEMGWYEPFKALCERCVIAALDGSIYPGLQHAVLHQFSSTPLTMARLAGNSDGAITGWSFTNHPIPAESRLPRIMNAITTPVPHVFQAGQWTYSPAGLPISIITGKLAADRVKKEIGIRK
jgi:phytoene dehydrogenase-like protein